MKPIKAIQVFARRVLGVQPPRRASRRMYSATSISAAAKGGTKTWAGVQSKFDEDAFNKDYLTALPDVIQRAQDLDVNNPDIGGWNRMRVAQILGKGVKFKHSPHPDEISLSPKETADLAQKVDRLRQIHSRTGEMDATGRNRSEGKLQETAYLTAFINGACLIHRVWRPENEICPLSLELIPGVRISTPIRRAADPLISHGIEYADEHRSRVVGYHVRHVSKTRGDGFIPDVDWDFLPAEDCTLLSLTEQAGLDRALPHCVRVMRMARNRGEFMESAVECARAQTAYYGYQEAAPRQNAYDMAEDDTDELDSSGLPFTDVGNGVRLMYGPNGSKLTWLNAHLPEPDLGGFLDKTDERMSRGLGSSKSRFTRKVDSSWAGGRLEDQQDDPIIDQARESFVVAWQTVNKWFLEGLWLNGAVDLPGYDQETRCYWEEFRATFPGKYHINPVDTANAREKLLMLRSMAPQDADEEDGRDSRENLRKWAQWMKMREEVEQEFGLDDGSLEILFSGKAITSSAGEEIQPATPVSEPEPGADPTPAPPRVSPNRKPPVMARGRYA